MIETREVANEVAARIGGDTHIDADPFMLHLYAALAEKGRRLIGEYRWRCNSAGDSSCKF